MDRRANRGAAPVDEAALIRMCIDLLRGKYSVVAAMAGGSWAADPLSALDLDLCIIVREEVLDRAHVRVLGVPVDLFVCGEKRTRKQLQLGVQPHLNRLFSGARHIFGDQSVTNDLVLIAKNMIYGPAPAPAKPAAFAFRSRPYNLLRKFRDLRYNDPITAALIVSSLIQASIDAYFRLQCLWRVGIRDTMRTIEKRDPKAAAALKRVVEASFSMLCEDMKLLETMVERLVGAEPEAEEIVWIVQESTS